MTSIHNSANIILYKCIGNKYKFKYILFTFLKIFKNIFNRKNKNNYHVIN